MTSLIELTNSLLASNSSEAKAARKSTSYAWIASTLPSPPPPPTSTISPSVQQPPRVDSRESNAVLFGLPEQKSIIEFKALVDEVFEFLTEKSET